MELYKTRYSQAIPGVNRSDDSIQFIKAGKCLSHFGDGLQQPDKLMVDSAIAKNQGRSAKVWNVALNRIGESGVRNAFRARENKIRQWRELMNKEVDDLAKEIENVADVETDLLKKKQYFSNMARISESSSEYRKKLEDHDPIDPVGILLREEKGKIRKAENDTDRHLDELKACEKKLQKARNALMSEVEAKSMTLNIGKRCQHSEPLLSFPYIPADHPVDQIYHPNSEADWEQNLADKVQNSVSVRQEARNSCEEALESVRKNQTDTGEAWCRTSKALQEAVQDEEKGTHNIRNLLKRINQDISYVKQRMAYFFDDLKIQDRTKTTQLWRLQTMTYRPAMDHIRDAPIRKLDEEVQNIEKKTSFLTDNLTHNKDLLLKLAEERNQQTLDLERLSRKLFVEREHCQGIRRTMKIEGTNLGDYITPS